MSGATMHRLKNSARLGAERTLTAACRCCRDNGGFIARMCRTVAGEQHIELLRPAPVASRRYPYIEVADSTDEFRARSVSTRSRQMLADYRAHVGLVNTAEPAAALCSPTGNQPCDPVDFEIAVGHRVEGPHLPRPRSALGVPSKSPPVSSRTDQADAPLDHFGLRLLAAGHERDESSPAGRLANSSKASAARPKKAAFPGRCALPGCRTRAADSPASSTASLWRRPQVCWPAMAPRRRSIAAPPIAGCRYSQGQNRALALSASSSPRPPAVDLRPMPSRAEGVP